MHGYNTEEQLFINHNSLKVNILHNEFDHKSIVINTD